MAALPLHPRLAHMVAADGTSLSCLLAALVTERDILAGRIDELPVDLGLRLRIVAGTADDPRASRRAVERLRATAADIARRAGIPAGDVDSDAAGRVLALAFPDRLAIRRGGPGRFQLRTGSTAWVPADDPLAVEGFLIAADLDGKRSNARIRLAAAIDPSSVAELFSAEVEEEASLTWDGPRLVERSERRLGGIVLDLTTGLRRPAPRRRRQCSPGPDEPEPSPGTPRPEGSSSGSASCTSASVSRGRSGRSDASPTRPRTGSSPTSPLSHPSPESRPSTSPACSDAFSARSPPSSTVSPPPVSPSPPGGESRWTTPTGGPRIDVTVQEMFGSTTTPTVAGVPVVLRLLSPAGRPIQVTRDLAGFWAGSWAAVRKEMAGRYPKHSWPLDPGAA